MSSVPLEQIVDFSDRLLRVNDVPDSSGAFNGLQVERDGPVESVLAAVDASLASIEAAVSGGYDMLLVHHGLFWNGIQPLTGNAYKRVRAVVGGNVALYSAHIPLDVHPEVGNNALIASGLHLTELAPFGDYEGVHLGVAGLYDGTLDDLVEALATVVESKPTRVYTDSPAAGRVGVISGAGGSFIADAPANGVDTLITGEVSHHHFFDAEEAGVNLITAGHYATETFGVKALAQRLADEFGLSWDFFDHPTGL